MHIYIYVYFLKRHPWVPLCSVISKPFVPSLNTGAFFSHCGSLELSLTPGALVWLSFSCTLAPGDKEGNRYMHRTGQNSACLREEVYSFFKFQYTCLEKPKPETILRERNILSLRAWHCPEKILWVSSKTKQRCSHTLQRRECL